MFNLLPENLKIGIKSDYRHRLVVVILFAIIFAQVLSIVLLLPSWVSSVYKEKEVVIETEAASQSSLSKDTERVSEIIKSTNTRLDILNTALEYPKLTPFVNSIIANKNSSIHIGEILYTAKSEKTATISLGGISATRETLVSFVKSLEKTGLYKSVDLPVGNLAKDRNIDFSMSLNVEK